MRVIRKKKKKKHNSLSIYSFFRKNSQKRVWDFCIFFFFSSEGKFIKSGPPREVKQTKTRTREKVKKWKNLEKINKLIRSKVELCERAKQKLAKLVVFVLTFVFCLKLKLFKIKIHSEVSLADWEKKRKEIQKSIANKVNWQSNRFKRLVNNVNKIKQKNNFKYKKEPKWNDLFYEKI